MDFTSPATDRPGLSIKAVFAILAGAALIGAGAPKAAARQSATEPDDIATSRPRVPLPGDSGAPLPRPLDAAEAARVRRIFALQARADWTAAIEETSGLSSTLLLGHILSDRYARAPDTATPEDLKAWLADYGDEPDAADIGDLLARRAGHPPTPPAGAGVLTAPARGGAAFRARRLFVANRDTDLLREAPRVFARNDDATTGVTLYVTGLASWRAGRIEAARSCFDQAMEAEGAAPAETAAAAYWAARAAQRMGDRASSVAALRRAAAEPRAFYGQVARAALAELFDSDAVASVADIESVAALPAGQRAFALLQVDQHARALAELRALTDRLLASDDIAGARAVAAVAATLGEAVDGAWASPRVRVVRVSLPRLRPRGGFRVGAPLVYAIARTESNFDAEVVSGAGATGMMQLMPVTAGVMAGGRAADMARLHDPSVSLDLGQRYLRFLSEQNGIGDDLVRVLASYNAGVGGFARWQPDMRDNGDPLLYIEAIPTEETRLFVQRVLTYSWLYAADLVGGTDSLSDIAAGRFPTLSATASR